MKGSVRCKALTMTDLAKAEKHGKRRDHSSRRRIVRDESPLVFGGLDLRPQFDAHVADAKANKAAKKPVLHFLIRFPPELLQTDESPSFAKKDREARQAEMLRQAVAFVNETHGGDAVFAARVDRDEQGETIVDVFAAPKYEKRTKRTPADQPGQTWISATKHGKELAEKHAEELMRRHPKAKEGGKLTSPRMVGIALQAEFAAFFEGANGLKLDDRKLKGGSTPDWRSKEQHERIEAEKRSLEQTEALQMKQSMDMDTREKDLERREANIAERENGLRKIYETISSLIGKVATKLGVGSELKQIADAIERADLPSPEPEPEAEQKPKLGGVFSQLQRFQRDHPTTSDDTDTPGM